MVKKANHILLEPKGKILKLLVLTNQEKKKKSLKDSNNI